MSDTAAAVKQIVDAMPSRLDTDAASGIDAVFQYNLTGEGAATFYSHIKDGACVVTQGEHPAPAVTVTMAAADFVELSHGRLDGIMAFMMGKLKATGDLSLASKLQKLFRGPGI